MVAFLVVVFYIIPLLVSLRFYQIGRIDKLTTILCLIPVSNLVSLFVYITEKQFKSDFKLLLSKFRTEPKPKIIDIDETMIQYRGSIPPSPREIEEFRKLKGKKVKKLVKRVEPVPAKMTVEVTTKVVTYRLANDTEFVERFSSKLGKVESRYYINPNNELRDSRFLRSANHRIENLELGTIFENTVQQHLGEIDERCIDNECKYFKKDFIGENGEYFRVMSFKIDTEVEEVEIEYNNFRVVAREVEE